MSAVLSTVQSLLDRLGRQLDDPEEESFLLFSQSIPSQNLGFVDSKSPVLELTIGQRDLLIHQSPTILSSNRRGGTTGAVVWKITPLFASWISSSSNLLFRCNVLHSSATVLELGCGVSGIIGLSLASLVKSYVLTDQDYVMKLLNQNLRENRQETSSSSRSQKNINKPKRGSAPATASERFNNVTSHPLDWETDEVTPSLTGSMSETSFEAVIACDCIYNDSLIQPLVQTCIDACSLRLSGSTDRNPTVCIVAQQLRSPEIFGAWLMAFDKAFRVWRLPDAELIDGLKSDSGFVIHVGILRHYWPL